MPDGRGLHPEIAKVLASLPAPPPGPLDPDAMRAAEEAMVPPVEERLSLHSVEDSVIAGIPVRTYAASSTPVGTLVYIHGGAGFLGSLDTHDHLARSLARATGRRVVSVGYRLAPEHPGPAGFEDCYAVVTALAERGPLALAGDSSGGGWVAAVAAKAHDEAVTGITHQVLYYPGLDNDFAGAIAERRYASLADNAEGYGLTTEALVPFNAFYLAGLDVTDPLISPIRRTELSGLPKALIITAQLDPLRDEGERYGRRLQEAGVPATVSRYDGAGHGFVQHFSWLPEYARVFDETAAFLEG